MTALFKFCIIALVALVTGLGVYGLTAPRHDPAPAFAASNTGVFETVLWVRPDSAAAKAGLHPGDVIDNAGVSTAQFFARHFSRTGQRIALKVSRNGTERTIVFFNSAVPKPNPPERTGLGFAIVLFGLMTALLVGLRQSHRSEARLVSLFLIALSGGTVLNWMQDVSSTPTGLFVWRALQSFVAYAFANFGLIAISATLPNVPTRTRAILRRTALPLTGAFLVFMALFTASAFTPRVPLASVSINGVQFAEFSWQFIANVLIEAIPIVACLDGLLHVDAEHRAQMNWIAAGMIASSVAWLVPTIALLAAPAWQMPGYDWISLFFNLPLIVVLSYVVLRHRLIDLSLVVSRAAVFGTVSIVVVSAFVLAEWIVGKLAESRFPEGSHGFAGQALVLAAALAIGLSARTIHLHVERRLNDMFFARRARALAHLRRFAHEADVVVKSGALLRLFYEAVCANTDASYAGIYLRDGATFVLSHGSRADMPQGLDEDEPSIVQLRRWNEPYERERDERAFSEALIIPMTVHGTLFGLLVCGPKKERTHFAGDEIDALAQAAHRTAIAYVFLSHQSVGGASTVPLPAFG